MENRAHSTYSYSSTSTSRREHRASTKPSETDLPTLLKQRAVELAQKVAQKSGLTLSFADLVGATFAATVTSGVVFGLFPIPGTTTALCTLAAVLYRLQTRANLNFPLLQLLNYVLTPVQLALIYPFMCLGSRLVAPNAELPSPTAFAASSTPLPSSALEGSDSGLDADNASWLIAPIVWIQSLGFAMVLAVVGWVACSLIVGPFLYLAMQRVSTLYTQTNVGDNGAPSEKHERNKAGNPYAPKK